MDEKPRSGLRSVPKRKNPPTRTPSLRTRAKAPSGEFNASTEAGGPLASTSDDINGDDENCQHPSETPGRLVTHECGGKSAEAG